MYYIYLNVARRRRGYIWAELVQMMNSQSPHAALLAIHFSRVKAPGENAELVN